MAINDSTFDIIFAGGGTCACITASRLAEADPSLKILILESGPTTKDDSAIIQPGRHMRNLLQGAATFSYHIGKPSSETSDKPVIVPAGRCLGGGSSINFGMYTRAAASDYDDWETKYSNPGWGSEYLIPLLKKSETFQPTQGELESHGTTGPLKVSYSEDRINIAEQFLQVAKEYDPVRGFTEDTNDFRTCNAYGRWAQFIDSKTGRRSDIPHNYIYNHPEFKNLTILTGRRVTRVLFENNCAVGVEHVDDTEGRPKKTVTDFSVSHASRLVVLSAGAFGSPAILERSGIGATEILSMNDIKTVVDLPGVGENYRDHPTFFTIYSASDDSDTLDAVFRGTEEQLKAFEDEWHTNPQGLLAHNAIDAGIKLRPTEQELEELGPAFRARWEDHFLNAPDKAVLYFGCFAGNGGPYPTDANHKYFATGYYIMYPLSLGKVHITDGHNPYAALDFEPGFLKDPLDLTVLRWGYKKAREFGRRMKSYRGAFKPGHPKFLEDSALACKETDTPVVAGVADYEYSEEDHQAIDDFHRDIVSASHSMGTCAMKPRADGGVVDSNLNVYGVTNLKVADCSIAPSNVGANTYSTAIAIGEKAAVIIIKELGIVGVTGA